MDAPEGFKRGKDGILRRHAAWHDRSYKEPREAIMTMYAGKERLGCNESIYANYGRYPCGNTAKHDPDQNGNPTKCGHHNAARKAAKKAKAEEKDRLSRAKYERSRAITSVKSEMLPLIQSIADGHNDPRTACQEWINRYNEATAEEAPSP